MPFTLPPLSYGYADLEPHLDEATMRLHHDKHHQTYVDTLNAALEKHPEMAEKTVEELLSDLQAVPEDIRAVVRNHGGGHHNHTLFWESMTPHSSGEPGGALAEAIATTFGDLAGFQEKFNEAGSKQFGSGWAWLVKDVAGTLSIMSTANQDSPLSQGLIPLLGNDVWEHAYYLKYQNKRADYLKAWWKVVNWEVVGERFA
jgi:superoxide dismutase, Fe-Mn family